MKSYKHLTQELRYTIFLLLQAKFSKKEIANIINFDISTIYREINRNSINKIYDFTRAENKAKKRRKNSKKPVILSDEIKEMIIEKLKIGWSPEQISGRLKLENIFSVSHQTIYNWINKDKANGGKLYKYLRRKRRYKKRVSSDKYGIKDRVKITERAPIVDERSRIGDWEIDTIYSTTGDKTTILTVVDRMSRFTIASMLESRDSSKLARRLIWMLNRYNPLTITADNGTEFAGHKYVSAKLNCPFYFALPHHPWERGTNENTNGLIRQYLPSGKSFKGKSKYLSNVVNIINNRPRKCLGYLTAKEVFERNLVKRE